MKTGLYFGSFNPIHVGHLIIANQIANATTLDEIWFVVSPHNPLKQSATLLNENHRLQLVRLAIESDSRFHASNVEFKLPKPSYSINTLTYLKEKYPKRHFILIMGSDSFQNLPKWKNAEAIARDYRIYVYPRPGFEVRDSLNASFEIIDAPLLDISSTSIRKLIATRKSIRYLIPDPVREVIESQAYYSSRLENPSKK